MRPLLRRLLGVAAGLACTCAAADPPVKPYYVSPIAAADTLMHAVHPADKQVYPLYAESHAILIGQIDYQHWPDLQKNRERILELRDALEKHRFKVEVYFDLKADTLPSVLESFMRRRATVTDSRIVVFVSGHGWERIPLDRPVGYLLPTDAPADGEDRQALAAAAMAMPYFAGWARLPDPRHMLFVFDACFSGSFFARPRDSAPLPVGPASNAQLHSIAQAANAAGEPPVKRGPEADDYIFQRQPMSKGRQFLTTGSQGEVVPEGNIFTRLLIDSLAGRNGGEGQINFDHWLTAGELGRWLEQNTRRLYRGHPNAASPVFGPLRDENFEAGDMVFTRLDIPNPYLVGQAVAGPVVPAEPGAGQDARLGSANELAIQAQVNALSSEQARTRRQARESLSTLLVQLPAAQRQSAVERLLNQYARKSYRFQLGVATALAQRPEIVDADHAEQVRQELAGAAARNKDKTLSVALKKAMSSID